MNSVSENALLKENAGLRHRRPKNETKSKELKNSKLASVSGAHVARKRSIPAIGATDIFLRLSVFFLVFYWPVGAEVPPPSFGGRFRCAATPAGHRWGGGVIENDARDCSLWGLKWKVDPPDPVDKHGRIPYQPLGQQQQQQQQQPRQKKKANKKALGSCRTQRLEFGAVYRSNRDMARTWRPRHCHSILGILS